jgi:thiosulfate/3-mercaptopyruvate sulfurtransferase
VSANPKGYANPQFLIDPAGLDARLREASPAPLVIDIRPAEQFAAGQIPGAVHIDLFGLSLVDTDPAPLKAFLWIIEHLFASRGVAADRPVVVYDEVSGNRAGRAFWFLDLFGHADVRVLDGGFGAWTRAGLPVSREPVAPVATEWHGARRTEILATWTDVRSRLGDPGTTLLDTRSCEEHCGTLVRAARGGAIPGSIPLEWTNNLGPDGGFKPAAELKAMYVDAGVTPDHEIITYCQGGYRGANSYLALRLIGYPKVRNYLGSWREWGDRLDLPIDVPQPPTT